MQENQTNRAIECGVRFLEGYDGHRAQTLPYDALRRIFERASEHDCVNSEAYVFTWRDIATDDDILEEGKRLRRNIKLAIDRLDEHQEKLNEIAANCELDFHPVIEQLDAGGGSGNLSRYQIRPVPVDTSRVVDESEIPDGFIHYSLESIAKPNFIARSINGFAAKGLKFKALTGTLLFAIVAAVLASIVGLFALIQQDSLFGLAKTLLDIGIFIGALYLVFSPLYYCVIYRIIIAPTVLIPADLQTMQLEYSPTDEKRPNGSIIREFRIVSYVSECSICGERVEVEKGTGAMRGRLVGRCNASPREHIFTFDHISRLGKSIYSEYRDPEPLKSALDKAARHACKQP